MSHAFICDAQLPPSAATAALCQHSCRRSWRDSDSCTDGAHPQVDWQAVCRCIYGCGQPGRRTYRNVARMSRCWRACR